MAFNNKVFGLLFLASLLLASCCLFQNFTSVYSGFNGSGFSVDRTNIHEISVFIGAALFISILLFFIISVCVLRKSKCEIASEKGSL